ncbi:MAG TPA: alpha/beta hydrolase-fold protein, partial [Anaerolineales bacterium]|nr:alpha/beta hydrolase-fold protein [Anaerolineales bacterium]
KKYFLMLVALLMTGCGLFRSNSLPLNCDQSGHVEEFSFYSEIQKYDYVYNVYLPPRYNDKPERKYPVLYLIPGRGGGPDAWFNTGAADVFDKAILSGSVPPFIVVSTKNFSEDPYGDILYKELMPTVEENFRTLNERKYRAIAGGSLGAVSSYRMAFQYPDTFASAGMFGGGLIHGEESIFEGWLSVLTPENQPRIFLNSGEGDPLMLDRAQVMVTYLDEAGIENKLVSGPGDHTYDYWLKTFPEYLIWMARDW